VDGHVVAINDYLREDTNRKFDLSTPKPASHPFLIIMEICPPCPQIMHDVQGVLKSMKIVAGNKKGVKVDGINMERAMGRLKKQITWQVAVTCP
jgi:hypothetical protein